MMKLTKLHLKNMFFEMFWMFHLFLRPHHKSFSPQTSVLCRVASMSLDSAAGIRLKRNTGVFCEWDPGASVTWDCHSDIQLEIKGVKVFV